MQDLSLHLVVHLTEYSRNALIKSHKFRIEKNCIDYVVQISHYMFLF